VSFTEPLCCQACTVPTLYPPPGIVLIDKLFPTIPTDLLTASDCLAVIKRICYVMLCYVENRLFGMAAMHAGFT